MSNLARHIEYLLFEHDHVAVPGLGTFACTDTPLHHDDDDGMFYVPRRDVSFIPTAEDDGLLAASVASMERCTPDESNEMIWRWVQECILEVQDCGTCDLGRIGQFVQDGSGMSFQPCKAGLMTPSYFGLDNFEMPVLPLLATQIKEAVERAEEQAEVEKKDNAGRRNKRPDHIVIRLNRTFLHYAASIAAGIVLFMALTTPTTTTTVAEASFVPDFFVPTPPADHSACEAMMMSDTISKVDTAVAATVAVAPAPVVATHAPSTTPSAPSATAEGYAVVVASCVKPDNARAMIDRLKQRGINGAQIFRHAGKVRVAFLGYHTYADAASAASQLRGKDSELEGAWVYEIK